MNLKEYNTISFTGLALFTFVPHPTLEIHIGIDQPLFANKVCDAYRLPKQNPMADILPVIYTE